MRCLCCSTDVASFFCARCKRAYYCSRKCQLEDWTWRHKYICIPRLSDLLLKCFEWETTGPLHKKNPPFPTVYLSNIDLIHIRERGCHTGPHYFKYVKLSIPENICVVCSKKLTYGGPLRDRAFTIVKNNREVRCYRCESCHDLKKEICPVTFQDTDECIGLLSLNQILCFIACARKSKLLSILPWEIVNLIFLIMKMARCCNKTSL